MKTQQQHFNFICHYNYPQRQVWSVTAWTAIRSRRGENSAEVNCQGSQMIQQASKSLTCNTNQSKPLVEWPKIAVTTTSVVIMITHSANCTYRDIFCLLPQSPCLKWPFPAVILTQWMGNSGAVKAVSSFITFCGFWMCEIKMVHYYIWSIQAMMNCNFNEDFWTL